MRGHAKGPGSDRGSRAAGPHSGGVHMRANDKNTPKPNASPKIRRMPPPWTADEAVPKPKTRIRTWRDLLPSGLAAARRLHLQVPRPPGPQEALGAGRRWAWQNRQEILAVAAITAVGAFLRLYRLDSIPAGLHGDEALNALRAHAILEGRWAGPYDPYHANGQPAGIEFWIAGPFALFGDSPFVLRMSVALLSAATLPLAYLLFRAIDGRATATIGATLLALSSWNLVLSRMALSSIMPVFNEVLAALAIVLALRHRSWWLFALAGVTLALGLYTNNTYPYFLVGAAVVLAGWLVAQRSALRPAALQLAALTTAFLVTSIPMIRYLVAHHYTYFRYARSQSLFYPPRFEHASGLAGKSDIVLDSGRNFVQLMVFEGGGGLPMLAAATSVLLGIGILCALRRCREPGIALALVLLIVISCAGVLNPTGNSVMIRRAVGVTPFIAVLAALPLSAALRSKYAASRHARALVLAAAVASVVSVGATNLIFLFGDYPGSPNGKTNYSRVQASRFLEELPDEPYVYFYSRQWAFDYEVRRYLAPDVQGEDRSGYWGSEFDLAPDREGDVVYLFLDAFLDTSQEVQRLYPGGSPFESLDDDGTVLFRAYELSATVDMVREVPEPGATPAATPTLEYEGDPVLRDLVRRQHLEQLRQALEQYATREGHYPDTGNQLQTLCVYRSLDVGCSLADFLPELPADPLGASTSNGYWYISDGASFVLIAKQESLAEEASACPEQVIAWARGEPRYCVSGP